MKLKTSSTEETKQWGKKIGAILEAGDIVCLQGSLGAGKTILAKGICEGLGVKREVTSPTYNVINEYRGKNLAVYHIDLYRIKSESKLHELGFEEYLYGSGVSIIEWPDKAGALMPDNYLDINIRGQQTNREIRLNPQGNKYISLLSELKKDADSGS